MMMYSSFIVAVEIFDEALIEEVDVAVCAVRGVPRVAGAGVSVVVDLEVVARRGPYWVELLVDVCNTC